MKKTEHWFKSVIGNKIIGFTPTRAIVQNNLKHKTWNKIKWNLIISLCMIAIIVPFDFLMLYFGIVIKDQWWQFFLFSLFNIIFGYVFLGNFSTLILFSMSYIKTNKNYSDDNFVDFKNTKLQFYINKFLV